MNHLVICSYPMTNSSKSKPFYEALIGMELARSLTGNMESWHSVVASGVQLTLNQRRSSETHAICHFSVANLDATIRDLEQKGGKKFFGPYDLPIAESALGALKASYQKSGGTQQVGKSMGTGALITDPDGNLVGLVQLAPFAEEAFKRGHLKQEDIDDHNAAIQNGKLIHA